MKTVDGAVETAVVRGMLLAYNTDRRLQAEELSDKHRLAEWWIEAGPNYFDETLPGVKEAVAQAVLVTAKRTSAKYETVTEKSDSCACVPKAHSTWVALPAASVLRICSQTARRRAKG